VDTVNESGSHRANRPVILQSPVVEEVRSRQGNVTRTRAPGESGASSTAEAVSGQFKTAPKRAKRKGRIT